jgi:LysR family glycine cleavage system transcriptional activator
MRLPPLNALKAFEAAARHGSFARAAEELHVGQGAVSRHVKLLEEHLGVALFRRLPRGLELTSAAHKLLPKISASFEMIMEAANGVSEATGELKVIAPSTLANRWLIPRLAGFKKLHPEIQVSVGIFRSGYDAFYRGNFDVGIACFDVDHERPAELEGLLIRRERLTPVCAPALMDGETPLSEPLDLRNHVLLHSFPGHDDWRKWLELAELQSEIDFREGQTYESMEMAVNAAVGGLGVAMADLYLIPRELDSGALVAPLNLVASDNTGYFLFCRRGCLGEPGIVAIRDWLLAESQADEHEVASRQGAQRGEATVAVR